MTVVYCFSGSGHSLAVSRALAGLLACEIREIGALGESLLTCGVAVVVFPVYCQNIPKPVKSFLKELRAEHVVLIATYGKISYGNVLYEAQNIVSGEVIAGAYIPMGHTFLDGDISFDTKLLFPIAERINKPEKIRIPKAFKNPLADIFPAFRSRIGVKITKNDRCTSCGKCEEKCPVGAIRNGKINSRCIRCLRCVSSCPEKALEYKNTAILDKYLGNYHKEDYVLYL
ncbi:MAG: hypothetical protein E7660_06700 [Ruminococcaceae bacterium]|nr:hypothetical protein [Oscillospiraceae bacterium]